MGSGLGQSATSKPPHPLEVRNLTQQALSHPGLGPASLPDNDAKEVEAREGARLCNVD